MESLKNEVAKGKKSYADMKAKQAEISKHDEVKTYVSKFKPEYLRIKSPNNSGNM